MKKVLLGLVALLLVAGSRPTHAQSVNAGDIRGTVTDPTGAVIPQVKVTAVNVATGVERVVYTDSAGVYDTSSIVTGNYKLTFQKSGFEQFVRGPITLLVGFTTVNAQMKVGSASVVVSVTSNVPLLQTDSGEQSTTLTSNTLEQLPETGSGEGGAPDWENFLILLPGATGTPGGAQGSSNPLQQVSINGNLPYSEMLSDGAVTTLSHSQNANVNILESVSQVQVNTSTFSAQYGIGGAIFNQISKGGTDQFHGAAYDYLQNSAFNAYPYEFGAPASSIGPIPYLRYNDFGGSVGGPIIRKKMFFYFLYDQIVDHGNSSAFNSIPTTAVMGGNFTGIQTIYDPTTQTIAYDSKGNPYPVRKSFQQEYGCNCIPTALFDSVAAKFQQWYPTPTSHIAGGAFVPGQVGSEGEQQQNFYSSLLSSNPFRRYFGRYDFDVTPNNRITMSDTEADNPAIYPNNVTPSPIGWEAGDVDNNNAQITDVWTISPDTINEARMGYTFQGNWFSDLSLNQGYPSYLGWKFAEANDLPAIQFYNTYPYAWIEPATNAVYKEDTFDPSDVVTLIRGKHILHFGGEFLAFQNNSTAWGNINAGTLGFTGQYTQQWAVNTSTGVAGPVPNTGMEYADFLLGYANSWSANVSPEYGARLKSPQVFIQDDYKVRPDLTLNLGLRYEVNHGWNEVKGNMSSFDPTVLNPATGTDGAYWFGETHANGRTALMANAFKTFLPRLGFSWLVRPDTTLRGGFGVYSNTWSLDTYGGNNTSYGMGASVDSSGSVTDPTNGIYPITVLDGPGTTCGASGSYGCPPSTAPLPYTAASTDPTRFNNSSAAGYIQYHTPVPEVYEWTLSLQRAFGTNYVAQISYVASHGFNLNFPVDINQVPANKLTSNDQANRPYPIYEQITGSTNNAISNYNSLQTSITRRMNNGISLSFNYTWSHMLDDQDSSGYGSRAGPQDWQIASNPAFNYSNSNFDVRDAFKGYAVYQLPFGKGKAFLSHGGALNEVVGDWQMSGDIVLTTGNPFTVDGTQNTYALSGSAFPNRNPQVNWKPTHQSITNWFNPQAFLQPADGTFGNVKRNSLYGPGLDEVNLSGAKDFALPREGMVLQFRCDATNAFNHPSFGVPGDATLGGSSGPGTPYTTGTTFLSSTTVGGRSLELALHLTY